MTARDRDMEVDPWAVVLRHSRWYLLCWSHTVDARRVLRIDRIVTASQALETFTPPTGLDALAVLEEHLSQGWALRGRRADRRDRGRGGPLAAAQPRRPVARRRRPPAPGCGRPPPNPGWYVGRLAVLPYAFHVNGSAELRQAAADLGRRLLAAASADSGRRRLSRNKTKIEG